MSGQGSAIGSKWLARPMRRIDYGSTGDTALAAVMVDWLLPASSSAVVNVSGAIALPALTLSGSASVAIGASGALALPHVTLTGAAAVAVATSGALQLPALGLTGSVSPAVAAAGSLALPALSLSGGASVGLAASGAVALPPLGLAGAISVAVQTAGALAFPALASSGSVSVGVAASGVLALPALALVGGASVAVAASGALSIPAIALDGSVSIQSLETSFGGSLALPRLAVSGSVSADVTIEVMDEGIVLTPLALDVSVRAIVGVSGALGLRRLGFGGSAMVTPGAIQVSGSLTLPPLQLSGSVGASVTPDREGSCVLKATADRMTLTGALDRLHLRVYAASCKLIADDVNITAGTTARIAITLRDFTGALADPATLEADVVDPVGQSTTLVYGVNAELTRSSVGKYFLIVATAIGVVGGYQVTGRSAGGVVAVGKTTIYAE